MTCLRQKHSAHWYNSLHPLERRNWMQCMPRGGYYLRIISRLRSGYADIGDVVPYRPESRCSKCGAQDTIEHLLLHCLALYAERCELFRLVSSRTSQPPSVSLLLGFAHLPNRTLRDITTATVKFVAKSGRKV